MKSTDEVFYVGPTTSVMLDLIIAEDLRVVDGDKAYVRRDGSVRKIRLDPDTLHDDRTYG